MSFKDRFQFIGISFMHDTMYGLFMNAEDLLLPAGLKEGQNVLEVGCGPGFFTIPAAKIVGENGRVFANDINPFAIKRVEKKISKSDVKNVTVMQEDVTKTSLATNSIDLAFFFGVIHSLVGIIDDVLLEMDRILTKKETIVIQKSRKSVDNIVELIEQSNKFKLLENKKRVLTFSRI